MLAISLWQPWASAIAVKTKRFETRSWPYPKSCGGRTIAIHAAKQWKREEREWAKILQSNGFDLGFEDEPPLGCIVAVARLVYCRRTEELYGPDFAPIADWNDRKQVEYQLGDYTPGRFAWKFRGVERLKVPILCRGYQGFWALDPSITEQIHEQLRRVF